MVDYKIMHKSQVIAETKGNIVTNIIIPELCPVMIKEGIDIRTWIELRSIDIHRSNSRRLYQALRLDQESSIDDKIRIGHAVTIGDNWWIQRIDEKCDYNKLRAYDKVVSDIALSGLYNPDLMISGYTELGTLGSFEKAWRKENGVWYLYKTGNKEELLSEYFSYVFLKEMDVNVAEYSVMKYITNTGIEKEYILSKDFTNDGEYNFEPFICYFGEKEDYEYIIDRLKEVSFYLPTVIEDYVRICFYDALLCNTDRHNGNIGFLRDSSTGQILSLAPAYDFNVSLASACNLQFTNEKAGYMGHFSKNALCVGIVKKMLPDKDMISNAVNRAVKETKSTFEGTDKACEMCGQYIIDAYDYFIEKQNI